MNDENKPEQVPDYVIRLDAERRREIDNVKSRLEEFLTAQLELKHSMEIVAKGQEQLKERFEIGTARTLRELSDKFDLFRLEWGEKKAEDKSRDNAIEAVKKAAAEANDSFRKYLLWPAVTICVSIVIGLLGFLRGGLH